MELAELRARAEKIVAGFRECHERDRIALQRFGSIDANTPPTCRRLLQEWSKLEQSAAAANVSVETLLSPADLEYLQACLRVERNVQKSKQQQNPDALEYFLETGVDLFHLPRRKPKKSVMPLQNWP